MTIRFKDLMAAAGMNIKQMSDYFNIPYRTVQDWAGERRTPPDYVLDLMIYKLETDKERWKQIESYTLVTKEDGN